VVRVLEGDLLEDRAEPQGRHAHALEVAELAGDAGERAADVAVAGVPPALGVRERADRVQGIAGLKERGCPGGDDVAAEITEARFPAVREAIDQQEIQHLVFPGGRRGCESLAADQSVQVQVGESLERHGNLPSAVVAQSRTPGEIVPQAAPVLPTAPASPGARWRDARRRHRRTPAQSRAKPHGPAAPLRAPFESVTANPDLDPHRSPWRAPAARPRRSERLVESRSRRSWPYAVDPSTAAASVCPSVCTSTRSSGAARFSTGSGITWASESRRRICGGKRRLRAHAFENAER